MQNLISNFVYGFRQIAKNPYTTAFSVLLLSIAIGMVAIVYSALQGVIFQSLYLDDSERIVNLGRTSPEEEASNPSWTFEEYKILESEQKAFESLARVTFDNVILDTEGNKEFVRAGYVGLNFFETFRYQPVLGNFFDPENEDSYNDMQMVISHSVWIDSFDKDSSVVGKSAFVDGVNWTIIGVADPKFDFPFGQDIWMLAPLDSINELTGVGRGVYSFGILREGMTVERAGEDVARIAQLINSSVPDPETEFLGGEVLLFMEIMMGSNTRQFWLMLFAITIFVLLIACANVSNIMMGKAIRRRSEFALRMALGASRSNLVTQLLVESWAIAMLAIFGSLIFEEAYAQIVFLPMLEELSLPDWMSVEASLGTVIFASIVSVASMSLSSLVPALRATNSDIQIVLKEGTRTGSSGKIGKFIGGLIVLQVSLAVIVLTGVGIMLSSTLYEKKQFVFYETDNVVFGRISLDARNFPTPEERHAGLEAFIRQMESHPAFDALAISNEHYSRWSQRPVAVEGIEYPTKDDRPTWMARIASAGYFEKMGIEVLEGREFTEEDRHGSPLVVMITEGAAERNWPGESPIGKRITVDHDPSSAFQSPDNVETLTVVGVIPDLWRLDVYTNETRDGYVRPLGQETWSNVCLYAHGKGNYLSLEQTIRDIGNRLQDGFSVTELSPLLDVIDDQYSYQDMVLKLVLSLGTAGLIMVGGGLYGVIAYATTQRRQEMAIRTALGASPAQNIWLSFFAGLKRVLIGIGLGLIGGFGLHSVLKDLIRPYQPDMLGLLILLIGMIVLASMAIVIPSWRSSKVEPMKTLRTD
ncbi:ABC transporter permease [Puniceicoccaceae bacterium K14]|nr:ABC transporter permease [Puniceicoccaceae bacterium K14]